MMTNGDPRDGFYILPSHELWNIFHAYLCFYLFIYLFIYLKNKLPEVSEYAKMQFHLMTLLDVLGKIAWVR